MNLRYQGPMWSVSSKILVSHVAASRVQAESTRWKNRPRFSISICLRVVRLTGAECAKAPF